MTPTEKIHRKGTEFLNIRTVGLAVLVLIVVFAFIWKIQNQNFVHNNELDIRGDINFNGDEKIAAIFSPPTSRDKFVQLIVNSGQTASLELNFPKKIQFNGLSFYFPGDLSTQTSYGAKKISIFWQDTDSKMHLLSEAGDNKKAFYRFWSREKIKTSKIELIFSDPFSHQAKDRGEIRVSDLKFYQRNPANFFIGIKNLIRSFDQGTAVYWVFYLIFFVLLFVPGYVFFTKLFPFTIVRGGTTRTPLSSSHSAQLRSNNKEIDNEFIFLLSPVFAITLMFLSTILFLASDLTIFLLIYPIIALFLSIEFIRKKYYISFFQNKTALIFMGLALLLIFLVVAQRDYVFNLPYLGRHLDSLSPIPIDGHPGYFADNFFPWRIARLYLHHYPLSSSEAVKLLAETTIYDRTPLLPMINVPVMKIFGEGHFVFQRFLEILAVLFVGAFYSLVRRYYSRRVAILATLLVLLNSAMFLIASNAEIYYKFFSIYPVFLALIAFFFIKKHTNLMVGCFLTLAFLIHPSTLIYSAAIFLLYIIRFKLTKALILNLAPAALILFVVCLGWFSLPLFIQNHTAANQSLYLSEISKVDTNILITKAANFGSLFLPNLLRAAEGPKETFSASYFVSYPFLRYSFFANLSPLFIFLLIYYWLKNRRQAGQLVLVGVAPLIIYWFFYLNQADFFFYYGSAYFILYPFVIPICLAFLVNYLMREKRFFRQLLLAFYILCMLTNLYYISGVFMKINSSPICQVFLWLIPMVYLLIAVAVFRRASMLSENNK